MADLATKVCQIMLRYIIWRSEAIFLGVICRSLGMYSSIVPYSLKEITATNQRPIGSHTHHSQSTLVLVPQSGSLSEILR